MRFINTEEFKDRINRSDLIGTDVWAKVLNILAECQVYAIVYTDPEKVNKEIKEMMDSVDTIVSYYEGRK